jgi:hypothetical protein
MKDKVKWEINGAEDVANAIDWVRRRANGKVLAIVAIGENAVAISKEVKVSPEDAADMLEAQANVLRRGFAQIHSQRVTRGYVKRED